MKLCFLTGEYPPMQGGVADHTQHLAHHLSDMGVQVSILTSTRAKGPPIQQGDSSVDVNPMITGWDFGCWRQIIRFLAERRPDVLHIQYQAAAYDLIGWVNWLPWWLRWHIAKPHTVVTFHDLRVPYLFAKAGRLRQWSILALARHADAVITTNEEDEGTLRQHPWATHVHRIPLGSNIEPQPPAGYDRQAWRQGMGIANDQLLLAYFGFLNQSKGGEELILVLDRLVQRGYDTHLMMIGGQVGDVDPTNQAYAEQVRTLIRARGLDNRVRWTGHISPSQVSANLLASDAVVMPYRDGVSFRRTTFIAALRHGCPVVTTQPAIPLPDLRPGENVLLAPVGDVETLADVTAALADDPTLRATLSAGASALGRRFDWSQIAQQTRQVYRRLGLD
jgi:glycosyltransferase involved in cell wall biosynthesis